MLSGNEIKRVGYCREREEEEVKQKGCTSVRCGVVNNSALTEMLLDYGAEVNDEEATYHVAEFDEHDCIRVLIGAGLDEKRQATILLRKIDFEDVEGVLKFEAFQELLNQVHTERG